MRENLKRRNNYILIGCLLENRQLAKNKILKLMPNKPQQPNEIQIVDNIPGSEYANLMQIGNPNRDEFHMQFITVSGLSGRIVSKIITNPGHFKRMVAVMNNMIEKYEAQYGKITEAPDLDKEIGFKG